MGDNPLVEETPGRDFSAGTFVISDLNADWKDMQSGSWMSGALDGAATAMDAQSFMEDPLGALLSMGAGWLLDHLDPLKTWLDQLTGTPEQVEAHAGTWENIGGRMSSTASQYRSAVSADLGAMSGPAIENYRTWADFHITSIESAAQGGDAIGSALKGASLFVETVHNIVRDLLAQLTGHIGSWLAEEFFSLGAATAWVVDQVVDEVSTLSEKASKWIHELISSCEKLKAVLAKIEPALKKLKEHAEGEKPLPDSHDKDKSHWDNAQQGAKNLPHQLGKDGTDDVKGETVLTAAHGARNDDSKPEPEPAR